ncbi:hypothetical protein BAE44_0002870 [Dichanthelium oligosanthes]|uniref:Uncharacterized protein n=1 Tax=Dichanthelium oligosanthes TaxID=888268 RepID=A0A1E5WFB3_9POAL|nr:hypothetical protein BAE44_0002870 [Dichanthelium oligosanthes]
MANHILQNPIIAAVIEDLNDTLVDVDAVQRLLDSVRAQIAANSAIYADEAAQLAEARRRLAEALFAAASRLARTEPEEQQPSALPEPEPKPGEEEMEELVAALAAPDFAEVAARLAQVVLQEEGEVVVQFEVADPEVGARAAEYLHIAVRVECSRQNGRILVQARSFLLLVRAAAFAITRAHLLPGVLLTVAVAYALAYAASGGTVVPGSASLLRISALVLCFLFGVPVVGNLA